MKSPEYSKVEQVRNIHAQHFQEVFGKTYEERSDSQRYVMAFFTEKLRQLSYNRSDTCDGLTKFANALHSEGVRALVRSVIDAVEEDPVRKVDKPKVSKA